MPLSPPREPSRTSRFQAILRFSLTATRIFVVKGRPVPPISLSTEKKTEGWTLKKRLFCFFRRIAIHRSLGPRWQQTWRFPVSCTFKHARILHRLDHGKPAFSSYFFSSRLHDNQQLLQNTPPSTLSTKRDTGAPWTCPWPRRQTSVRINTQPVRATIEVTPKTKSFAIEGETAPSAHLVGGRVEPLKRVGTDLAREREERVGDDPQAFRRKRKESRRRLGVKGRCSNDRSIGRPQGRAKLITTQTPCGLTVHRETLRKCGGAKVAYRLENQTLKKPRIGLGGNLHYSHNKELRLLSTEVQCIRT